MNFFNKISPDISLRIVGVKPINNQDKTITIIIDDGRGGYKQARINLQQLIEAIIAETIDRGLTAPNPDKHIIQNTQPNGFIQSFIEQTNLLFDREFVVEDDNPNSATKIARTQFFSTIADGILTTADVGNIPAGTPASDLKLKSFSQLFEEIFFATVAPTYTLPSFVVMPSNNRNEERGVLLNETILANFQRNDYGPGENYTLREDGVVVDSQTPPFPDGQITPGYFLNDVLTSTAGDSLDFIAQVDYGDAPAKNDNFGNPDPSPPLGGTLSDSWSITARNPTWAGGFTLAEIPESSPGVPDVDESVVKTGFEEKYLETGGGNTIVVTPDAGDNWLLVACAPGTNVISAIDQFNNPFNTLVTQITTADFTDAEDSGGSEVTYDVHYYYSPAGFSGAQDITITIG